VPKIMSSVVDHRDLTFVDLARNGPSRLERSRQPEPWEHMVVEAGVIAQNRSPVSVRTDRPALLTDSTVESSMSATSLRAIRGRRAR
jgi:hypothetical protein